MKKLRLEFKHKDIRVTSYGIYIEGKGLDTIIKEAMLDGENDEQFRGHLALEIICPTEDETILQNDFKSVETEGVTL